MNAKNVVRVLFVLAVAGLVGLVGCTGAGQKSSTKSTVLDPANPVQIELWTYYNGTQQQAFENLIEDFNSSRGKELGVVVTGSSQGSVTDLADAVTESAQELVGSARMPDAFLSYSDTALVIDNLGKVADLSGYLTDDEKAQYVDSFLAEGDLSGDGSLKVFPVAKSTETLQINLTDWQVFAHATGASLKDLSTIEGITATAQRYYEWTDALTAEVANDGRPFFGRDALANYLITGSKQLGHELFVVKDGVCTLDLDRATMRTLWDNYYVPMVQGWFSADGKFRSDAVKTGELLCYVGSSSSVVYFPQTVTVDDQTSYPIEMGALVSPTFANGVACAPQQGAGFSVTKSDEKKERACVEFLKWLTAKDQNTSFAISAGYVPVTKDALTRENLQEVAQNTEGSNDNYVINLSATLDTIEAGVYAGRPFNGGSEARSVLKKTLDERAIADRAAVVAAIDAGVSAQDAVEPYLGDASFDAWFDDLTVQLNEALA